MEWLEIIIKWINCLNVLDTPIKTINELHNTQLYEKLIKLSWKKDISICDNKDIVTTFIEDEYPEFQINKDKDQGYSEDIYIVSLLLSYISLNSVFHRPMCTKLPHEIQVKIKSFLEIVLPYGRSITKQILKDAIIDLTDSEKENLFKTPRKPSLKEFFSSPVARSAQSHRMLNEKNRQLRQLKSELETERFEKADLQEDLRIEQNKVRSLLKQLEEKSAEITTLKEEKIKFTSPQSCTKTKNSLHNEDYYKKEIYQLENKLMQYHDEVTKLEEQKTNISKKLMFTEKRNVSLNEKCNNLEISIETLTAEIEAKETELINLKISYEDLRTHMKKLNGTSITDESFESEDTGHGHSFLSPLNTSETLSSVIDIQLQEAKTENSLLKAQITQLKDKLDVTSKQYDNASQLIVSLQDQLKMLHGIEKKLTNAEEGILLLRVNNEVLENEKKLLQNQCNSLEQSLLLNDKLILQAEQSKKELDLQLNILHEKNENLSKALNTEIAKSSDLEKETQYQKEIINDHIKVENENTILKQKIHDLEVLNEKHKTEWDLASKLLHEKIVNLDKALNAEIDKASNLEKVESENTLLKQQIHDLVVLDEKHKLEWNLESKALHEKIVNLEKTLNAEIAKSSDLEQVTKDQKCIIDDHRKVESENATLKQKIHDLEESAIKHRTEWDLESKALHEKIVNSEKALNAEVVKSSDLEQVTKDQKRIIHDYRKVESENGTLKQKIHELEESEIKHRTEWDLESKALHQKIVNLEKALNAEIAKSSDLEQVTKDQKCIIDDHRKVESENATLKQKIHELEESEIKHRTEWDLESKALHQKIVNLEKALNAEIAKSSDLEQVTKDQKCIIDDHRKVESENATLKQKIHHLEESEIKHRTEWDLESKALHEKIVNSEKALNAEIAKSSDLEQVTKDQKCIIDDHRKVESENATLKQKIHHLEESEIKHRTEWDLESKALHEKIVNLEKALNAEIAKSSDLEQVTKDQKRIIDDHRKVESENATLKQKIHELEESEIKHRTEWDLESKALHEKIVNLEKALNAEVVKSSDLEQVTKDQKLIIDDYRKVESENGTLKQKIHELEESEIKHRTEWDLESKALHEKIINFEKALNAEIVKSSDLEQVTKDQKRTIDDHRKVESENATLKQKVHDLEESEIKYRTEWDLESKALHEKIVNLEKELNAEIVKSSDLEQVTKDQKRIIDDRRKVENENATLKQKIHDLEESEIKHRTEWDLESKALHEKIVNLEKALNAEVVKSSDLEQVTKDQKLIIDDYRKVESENGTLKQKIHELEESEIKHRTEWDLESKALHEKIVNLEKELNAEIVKSSDLEQVTKDQKRIIDDHRKVENENATLKQKIHDLEESEIKHRTEWDLESKALHEKIVNSEKALNAEVVKSSDLEQVTKDQKLIIDDYRKVESENGTLKQKIHELEESEIKHRTEWDLESKALHEKIVNLEKALNAEIAKSSDLEQVTKDQKRIIDDHRKVESENATLKQKIHDLEESEIKHRTEWDLVSKALHEKIVNLEKALNAEIAKSSELEKKENDKPKLQLQIDQLVKEKKEIKNKMDIMRVRNAKLERTLEEVRAEKKKVQEKLQASSQSTDLDNLKKEVAQLKDSNLLLQEEINKRNKESKENIEKEISETRLKEIHSKYEVKLEEMKHQMKVAYNEQVVKLNREQEKAIQEKVEQFQLKLEEQCQKHKEEIAKYKTHLNELNSQFWNVGEKLLTAQQEKQEVLLQLNELKIKLQNEVDQKSNRFPIHHKTIKSEKPENPFENSMQDNSQIFSKVLTEENAHEKQHSARNMHAIVNAFNAEDEEGEVFDNTYLADMKRGYCFPTVDLDRLSILRKRNSLCKPHLKSSYPAETQFQPLYFSEEEIKTGSVSEDIFNDSLSQILLPEQKTKKRDRTQTSYKKPGPPTPSKNGGRLSLHGSEIKSPNSKVLKERNADRRATATPRRSKGIFTLKRQDENVAGTPRARRLSNMFRKARTTSS